MKNTALLILSFFLILTLGCVQKTRKMTVIYTLKIQDSKTVSVFGVRGNNDPLSWDKDLELKIIYPDSIYQAIVTYNTGYKFTEVKFTKNGEFELQNSPNRRVEFSDSDTTYFEATFDNFQ